MSGFEVDPEALRVAAGAARQAAEVVRKLELGRVAVLAAALPGTESAGTAGRLGRHWEASGKKWAEGMASYADALTSAARDYQARDDAAAHSFGMTGGR
ncbi:hypothetical protein LX15_000302 [Streptoalloteichus tenebrarius]|uniref:Uncharacterized protein n=1 Tax=Streptoalloteichus tenebrarius (strain ATCC 17920 / DSM 40477 / JCM 4838 / CBS 697.72 / NBRC 16177 / NCIMB 11028 / NRRL B-12390 / A12253. 1 / ISP 5477) TaxID=1933 RepID=A0ABT1HM66_STRSD|nr:hypothetical protein [Streptoalloteichus tenebrarius]MCP2256619.1 hypothetical protein [Streptoalloteichus tenebrarius]BFF04972.1 hypothetical protein GCM10020241_66470 [Streptoalloteichus tenebrarius]